MLVDWNSGQTTNADVVLLWGRNALFGSQEYRLATVDSDADGIPGTAMLDGDFKGFTATYNIEPVPLPTAVWLFSSGLMGLLGMSGRNTIICYTLS
jgi:hypothetical protein